MTTTKLLYYICAMPGSPEALRAASVIRSRGHEPILPIDGPMCVHVIGNCDVVYICKGWQRHPLTTAQKAAAALYSCPIEYEEPDVGTATRMAVIQVTHIDPLTQTAGRTIRTFHARMIYTHEALRLGMEIKDVVAALRRSIGAVRYYRRKFGDEYRFNARFKRMADKVSNIINKSREEEQHGRQD